MDLITDTFIIFSCLMFWIVFHNKKGLLSEIKKTEKKISEKIIILEDLLDQHSLALKKVQASAILPVTDPEMKLVQEEIVQDSVLPAIDPELSANETSARIVKLEPQINSTFEEEKKTTELDLDSEAHKTSEYIVEPNTEYRVLGLPEELLEDQNTNELEVIPLLPVQAKQSKEEQKSEPSDNYLTGVQNMVLEAKENLLKIDVSDVQEIRTFKDVVLMSKKIEMEKQQFKFK